MIFAGVNNSVFRLEVFSDTMVLLLHLWFAISACVALAQPFSPSLSSDHDSAAAISRRDSLMAYRQYQRTLYRRLPNQADSLVRAEVVRLDQLFVSDANGLSEALRFCPKLITIPFSLVSSRNRLLLYGYPFDLGCAAADARLCAMNPLQGSDLLSISKVASVSIAMPDGMRCEMHPRTLVAPEVSLFWENGVFRENLLGVRVSRPIGPGLDVGLFSDYRYLAGKTYSHDNGDVFDFFSSFTRDTSLLSRQGRNPLTNEHIAGGRLRWAGQGATAEVLYQYTDTDHDAVLQNDSLRRLNGYGPLLWERVYRYDNYLYSALTLRPVRSVAITGSFSFDRDGHRVMPFSRAQPRLAGRENGWGLSLRPQVAIFDCCTVSAAYELWNAERQLYTGRLCDSRLQRIGVQYQHPLELGPIEVIVRGQGGRVFYQLYDSLGSLWTGEATLAASMGLHGVRIFTARHAFPYLMPYDSSWQVDGRLLDEHLLGGVEASFLWSKAGLLLSYCLVSGVDSSTVFSAWPHGAVPYTPPQSVVTVAPLLGRWHGVGLLGRCMVSDVAPHVKAQLLLSYQAVIARGNAHVCIDASIDYWSSRNAIRFGDPLQWKFWKREIYDASLRAAVQIASFRLFYKVDNLLNRRIAYVPGYFMPGLTFRWGFAWIIQE